MTHDDLRSLIELELVQMRKWEQRDYELERAFIDLLETDLKDDAVVKRAMMLLNRKTKPEGNA